MTKRKKKKIKAKYIFRRFFLITVLLGMIGGGVYLAYAAFFSDEPAAAVQKLIQSLPKSLPESSAPVSTMTSSKSSGSSGAVSATSPESSSKPEPSSKAEEKSESKSESSSSPESKPESKMPVSTGDWELILVNNNNPLPQGYVPELAAITETYSVDTRIADNLKRMFADAKRDGINLTICSAYRSVEKQTTLFEAKKQEFINQGKKEQEAVASTATIIAKPGTSEHHTGLAVDIVTPSYMELDSGFANTPAFKWLDGNAYKYGFVMRYPIDKQDITKIIYEPWHYRFVGEYNASVMKKRELCLEEYVDALEQAKVKALAEAAKSGEPDENGGDGNTDADTSKSET